MPQKKTKVLGTEELSPCKLLEIKNIVVHTLQAKAKRGRVRSSSIISILLIIGSTNEKSGIVEFH